MRTYFFVEALDPTTLPGYVADAHRGHGPELWLPGAKMPVDYPERVALLSHVVADVYQVSPLTPTGNLHLGRLRAAGFTCYATAKVLEVQRPDVADALYPTRPKQGGRPGEVERIPGGKLRLPVVLVGDVNETAANPRPDIAPGRTS